MKDTNNTNLAPFFEYFEYTTGAILTDYQKDKAAALLAGLPDVSGSGFKHRYFLDFLKSGPGELFPVIGASGSDDWVNSVFEAEKQGFQVILLKVEPARAYLLVETIEKFLQHNPKI